MAVKRDRGGCRETPSFRVSPHNGCLLYGVYGDRLPFCRGGFQTRPYYYCQTFFHTLFSTLSSGLANLRRQFRAKGSASISGSRSLAGQIGSPPPTCPDDPAELGTKLAAFSKSRRPWSIVWIPTMVVRSQGRVCLTLVLDRYSHVAGRREIATLIDYSKSEPVDAVGESEGNRIELLDYSVDDGIPVYVADHVPGGGLLPLAILYFVKLKTLVVGCALDRNSTRYRRIHAWEGDAHISVGASGGWHRGRCGRHRGRDRSAGRPRTWGGCWSHRCRGWRERGHRRYRESKSGRWCQNAL